MFGANGEIEKLPPGSFSSPVRVADLGLQEKGFGIMEKPVFISKGQKVSTNSQNNGESKSRTNIPIVGNSAPLTNVVVKSSQLGINIFII